MDAFTFHQYPCFYYAFLCLLHYAPLLHSKSESEHEPTWQQQVIESFLCVLDKKSAQNVAQSYSKHRQ